MTQPTFSEGPPIPLLVEGLIDAATLKQILVDLSAAATVTGVHEKGDPHGHGEASSHALEMTFERLLQGTARAVQVRYRFDGHDWSDTIIRSAAGFRIVRCRYDQEKGTGTFLVKAASIHPSPPHAA